MRPWIGGIDLVVGIFLRVRQTNEGLRQTVRMIDVIETEAALDAKAVVVRRSVAAFSIDDPLVLYLIRNLAADAAIGAKRIHGAIGPHRAFLRCVVHERSG